MREVLHFAAFTVEKNGVGTGIVGVAGFAREGGPHDVVVVEAPRGDERRRHIFGIGTGTDDRRGGNLERGGIERRDLGGVAAVERIAYLAGLRGAEGNGQRGREAWL